MKLKKRILLPARLALNLSKSPMIETCSGNRLVWQLLPVMNRQLIMQSFLPYALLNAHHKMSKSSYLAKAEMNFLPVMAAIVPAVGLLGQNLLCGPAQRSRQAFCAKILQPVCANDSTRSVSPTPHPPLLTNCYVPHLLSGSCNDKIVRHGCQIIFW